MQLITTRQKVLVTAKYNRGADEAPIEGDPVWASSDTSVLTIEPGEDANSVWAVSGAAGSAQLSVRVDGDLGEGVEEAIGLLDFEVVPHESITITFTVGAPVLK